MTIQGGLHHRSVHIPVKPKTQAKPNCENTEDLYGEYFHQGVNELPS